MITKVFDLPIPGSGCGDARITYAATDVTAEFDYGGTRSPTIGTLVFESPLAFRFAEEPHSRGVPAEAYDTVVAVARSEWLSSMGDTNGCRHYAVYFSNVGYLEVIARSVRLEAERSGTVS